LLDEQMSRAFVHRVANKSAIVTLLHFLGRYTKTPLIRSAGVARLWPLHKSWIGIDITHLSIALQKYRLEQMFPGIRPVTNMYVMYSDVLQVVGIARLRAHRLLFVRNPSARTTAQFSTGFSSICS
jgi:hypothetical protein